jgi:hypothetical protein
MSSLCIKPFTKNRFRDLAGTCHEKDVLMSQKNIELKETEALLRLSGTVIEIIECF